MTEKNTSIRTKTRHPADFLTYIAIYVCAIILVMLLIYAAICYLEWRLAQKEGGSVTLRNANSHPDAQQMGLLPVRLPALKTDDL